MNSPRRDLSIDLLVIGYGNTLRSDDGVGQRIVEAIQALHVPGVHTVSCDLLTPEFSDLIAQAREVIFVDASVDAPAEVQLQSILPSDSSQILAHAADPATLLALARDIFGHAPQAWWLTIPVENLEIGEDLSPKAELGMVKALKEIKARARSRGRL